MRAPLPGLSWWPALLFLAAAPAGGTGPACPDPHSCVADYLHMPFLVPAGVRTAPPLSGAQVDAMIEASKAAPPVAGPLARDELAAAIRRALNLDFLMEGLAGRPLQVSSRVAKHPGYEERTLLLRDPYVGSFDAILLVPDGPGPFPAVVAIHGHGDRAETYRDDYHGRDYPSRGFAILMLTMRAMNIDRYEHEAASRLLSNGLHLMGVRVYEALLALKVLRGLPEIDPERIGLIGHSGGSSTANLVVRIEPSFRALVTDHQVDYYQSGAGEPYHCETEPGLHPLHRLINDTTTSETPIEQVRYAYGRRKLFGRDRKEIAHLFDFFERHLGPVRAATAR